MLKLRSLKLRNFQKVSEAEIEFPEYGVVQVLGSNLSAGDKMPSVGSGKSTVGDAIARALFDIPGRFTAFKDYSTDDGGNTLIEVKCDLDGRELTVLQGYKCAEISKRGEGLRYFLDGGEPVERDTIAGTRSELAALLGVPAGLASWTSFLDGDRMKFNELPQQTLVEIVMSALRQPSWSGIRQKAKVAVDALTNDLLRVEQAHTSAKETVVDAEEDVVDAEQKLREAVAAYERQMREREGLLAEAEAEVVRLENTAKAAEEEEADAGAQITKFETRRAKEIASMEKDRLLLKSEVGAKQRAREAAFQAKVDKGGDVREAKAVVTSRRSVVQSAKATLETLKSEPEKCPECGQKLTTKVTPEQIAKAEAAVVAAEENMRAATREVEAAEKSVEKYATALADADRALETAEDVLEAKTTAMSAHGSEEMRRLSGIVEVAKTKARRALSNLTGAKATVQNLRQPPDKSLQTTAEAVLADRRASVVKAKVRVQSASEDMSDARRALAAGKYWYEGFGPAGIPNLVLTDSVWPMNDAARLASGMLTGGAVGLTFSTSRELARGGEAAELVISVVNRFGSTKIRGSSKGETGLVNLILSETLSTLGSIQQRVGFRWYDEVINPQDAGVRTSFLSAQRERAHRDRSLIFVVDHHAEVERYADHVLVADKSPAGCTSYRWELVG